MNPAARAPGHAPGDTPALTEAHAPADARDATGTGDAIEPAPGGGRRLGTRRQPTTGRRTGDEGLRLAGALTAALLAVGLKLVLAPGVGADLGYLGDAGAVAIAAWLAGWQGGLMATIVCAVAEAAVLERVAGTFVAPSPAMLRLALFLLDGLLVTLVTTRLHGSALGVHPSPGRLGRRSVAAERARLAAAVARFEATVDDSADAVFMFDPSTLQLTYVNRSAAELVEVDPKNLAGRTILALHPTTDEAGFRQRLEDVRGSRDRSGRYADVLTRHDGRDVPVDVLLREVTLPDGSRSGIVTARDSSERIAVQARLARIAGDERRQAAELRAVIQSMGEGVLVADPDGQISLANEAAAAILPGDLPATINELEERLGVHVITERDHAVDDPAQPDHSPTVRVEPGRWLEITTYSADLAGSLTSEEGHASRIIVIRDVTRSREAEAAREAFLGVLSHELRTPVTTIFGYSKVLRRPGHRRDQADMLADIEVEADRLYRIVEDLLALSRVEGGITIDGEPLLLQHLVGPVVASEAQRWAGVTFEVAVQPDVPAVFGERTYVEQVIRNLVSNAGKYSPPGTAVTIQVDTGPVAVAIRVLDRGSGIRPEEADQLFDLYYRSSSTAARASGAGIGLYICRGLVHAMGGQIWARPRPGGGSEFGFNLPRADEDAAAG